MARAAAGEIEVIPEVDKLDGVPHPRATLKLHGHSAVEEMLADSFAGGRMHHGWLISGAEGVGKATLAYRFAKYVLCRPDERPTPSRGLDVGVETSGARQVFALSHPGLLVLRRPWDPKTKKHTQVITVDEVRRLRSFLGLRAEPGAARVVLVDTADQLNVNAANALLKSLEEPPPNTYFLLLTSSPGRLLPTIRSRCRVLDLSPLAEPELRRAVMAALEPEKADPPGVGDWPRLISLAEGSPRRALSLWLGEGLKLDHRVGQLLERLPQLDWAGVHQLADELASAAAAERFEMFYDLLLKRIARMVRAAAGAGQAGPEEALARRLVTEAALATWAELWETLAREKSEAQALNLDRKTLILQAFGHIGTAARQSAA